MFAERVNDLLAQKIEPGFSSAIARNMHLMSQFSSNSKRKVVKVSVIFYFHRVFQLIFDRSS